MYCNKKLFVLFVLLALYFLFLNSHTLKFSYKIKAVINNSGIITNNADAIGSRVFFNKSNFSSFNRINNSALSEMKYILLWTDSRETPFIYFNKGQKVFLNKNCAWNNCYVTDNRNYLGDYTEFEVIVFNGPRLNYISHFQDLPKKRFTNQKYVYANIESSDSYPVCTKIWNGYFNWTWTYKLNSNSQWGYLVIRDKSSNNVIGPSLNMQWIKFHNMDTITDYIKVKLKSKRIAAAWFASNCNTLSLREDYVNEIQINLRKFNLDVDIYGACGTKQCPKDIMNRCLRMLEREYYFYFAFENSLSEDYVTEKILYALHHNTVPVVYGGANYSRFLPPGSYLNVMDLSPEKLARKMYEAITQPTIYYDYFRWKKYYTYHFRHESPDTDDYCRFCAIINDKSLMKQSTVYNNFDSWWTDANNTCNNDNIFSRLSNNQ